MPAHVDGDDVIIRRENRRKVIELMRHPADAMQHNERRFVGGTPVQIVKAQAIHDEETVRVAGRLCTGKASADDAAGQNRLRCFHVVIPGAEFCAGCGWPRLVGDAKGRVPIDHSLAPAPKQDVDVSAKFEQERTGRRAAERGIHFSQRVFAVAAGEIQSRQSLMGAGPVRLLDQDLPILRIAPALSPRRVSDSARARGPQCSPANPL